MDDDNGGAEATDDDGASVLSYKQVWMGMIAIFLYVGVEVRARGIGRRFGIGSP